MYYHDYDHAREPLAAVCENGDGFGCYRLAELHQLVVRAGLDDAPRLHDVDAVRMADGGGPVGGHDRRAVPRDPRAAARRTSPWRSPRAPCPG